MAGIAKEGTSRDAEDLHSLLSSPARDSVVRNDGQQISSDSEETDTIEDEGASRFRWREIRLGTENFGTTHLISPAGNLRKVYLCHLPRVNKFGAVKINTHEFDHGAFAAETTTLRESDNPHVIKLIGKHYGLQENAIVYEFMQNGSLDHHLFEHAREGQGLTQPTRFLNSVTRMRIALRVAEEHARDGQGLTQPTRFLDWVTRMTIAVGVAKGLLYVHKDLSAIHGDVCDTNILLDDNLAPKLSDFGCAAEIVYNEDGTERQREMTTEWTLGYIAPETEEFRLVSTKSDVYSYGVFLLVLFTGRKAFDMTRPNGKLKLTDWLLPVLGSLDKHASPRPDIALGNKYSKKGLKIVFDTARICTSSEPFERPDMHLVISLVREAMHSDSEFQNIADIS